MDTGRKQQLLATLDRHAVIDPKARYGTTFCHVLGIDMATPNGDPMQQFFGRMINAAVASIC